VPAIAKHRLGSCESEQQRPRTSPAAVSSGVLISPSPRWCSLGPPAAPHIEDHEQAPTPTIKRMSGPAGFRVSSWPRATMVNTSSQVQVGAWSSGLKSPEQELLALRCEHSPSEHNNSQDHTGMRRSERNHMAPNERGSARQGGRNHSLRSSEPALPRTPKVPFSPTTYSSIVVSSTPGRKIGVSAKGSGSVMYSSQKIQFSRAS